MMRHGSLFSGIGGFDLAAEWMGWENVFHCEWNTFGQKVLKHYWPNADSYSDICKTNFKKYANTIDILTGGFPCQPFSTAGKRKGTDDERYLWHEMLRAINEIKPKFVIAENVYGITNIDGGLVFESVCLDLEANGYEVQPYIIPACAKNAPHRRDRVWFVAQNTLHSGCLHGKNEQKGTEVREFGDTCTGSADRVHLSKGTATDTDLSRNTTLRSGINGNGAQESTEWEQPLNEFGRPIIEGTATDTIGIGYGRFTETKRPNITRGEWKLEENIGQYGSNVWSKITGCSSNYSRDQWKNFPTQSPICSGDDGLPTKLDGITFSKWRNESIKAYGNAIVPQVAFELFKTFNKF